jgi:hypothetical protein
LTTFAGGWIVLPAPINWNYVFANLDFAKNKTIYLTIIIIAVLYYQIIFLMINIIIKLLSLLVYEKMLELLPK